MNYMSTAKVYQLTSAKSNATGSSRASTVVTGEQKEPPPPLSFTKKASNFIHNKQNQHTINYIANGGASILNLFSFLNGNFKFMEGIQEKLEMFTDIYTKAACGIQGFIVAANTIKKKNVFPFIGNALEI